MKEIKKNTQNNNRKYKPTKQLWSPLYVDQLLLNMRAVRELLIQLMSLLEKSEEYDKNTFKFKNGLK